MYKSDICVSKQFVLWIRKLVCIHQRPNIILNTSVFQERKKYRHIYIMQLSVTFSNFPLNYLGREHPSASSEQLTSRYEVAEMSICMQSREWSSILGVHKCGTNRRMLRRTYRFLSKAAKKKRFETGMSRDSKACKLAQV